VKCSRCESDRLFQFEANPTTSKRAVNPSHFPLVCRSCGQISIDGVPLQFPQALEDQAKDLAEAAAKVGKEAVVELATDPNARVEKYFAKVYREAYLDGFLRAVAFYQHNVKEGKLKRLRELWSRMIKDRGKEEGARPETTVLLIFNDIYDEFDQLMMLGPVPD
jgi:hypothetical protein